VTRAEFEAELPGDGTKSARAVLSRTWIVWRTPMTLYGRVVVLYGTTLVFDDKLCSYCPGDFCSIRAGAMHEEHTEYDGVCYVFGRRSAAAVAAQ
jgi:hypothetical protein